MNVAQAVNPQTFLQSRRAGMLKTSPIKCQDLRVFQIDRDELWKFTTNFSDRSTISSRHNSVLTCLESQSLPNGC